ncbi:hypothetical protein D3P09_02645 [Paenibacillus pinisoli]|uniref:Uncharacterized protein n=1 Tax=Paenibacillus pinisoli TaxID=1276110 RepID=A0A3A6Q4Z2_9BACL|nr:ATPase, T2SS/T4P/T4SS family [Paenibacillus pinisoli]RJX40934.1 hypothetical protein D3P09_02645 [Paenibacillus pinisoli]
MSKWLEKNYSVADHAMQSPVTKPNLNENPTPKRQLLPAITFQAACEAVKKYFKDKHAALKEEDLKKWQNLQHDAVLGNPSAVSFFLEEIESFIQRERIFLEVPKSYASLTEGLFQETFGLGIISAWWKHPKFNQSQSARIIGTNVYFDIPGEKALQPYGYDSLLDVETIIEKIRMKDEFANISKFKPKLEIDMADGTRVMIMIPPRVRQPVIVFRNYTLPRPTLEQLARNQTMSWDMVPITEAIARAMVNLAILGKVRSGKSTLLKALFALRYREGQVAVNIERTHAELRLIESHPDAQIIEMIAKTEEDYEEIFDQVLRSDYHFCVISELRSLEAEIYNVSSERGEGGSMTSYHTDRVKNMPGQIARLILQRYPSRKYEEELIRVAENLNIVFVMRELPGGAKRLDKICEIQLDSYSLEVSVHDIIRWDSKLNDYTYNNGLSERTKKKMIETAPEHAEIAFNALKRLAGEKPMIGDCVEVALSHVRK